YFRVLTQGRVRAGDEIEVTHRPAHGVTIGDAFRRLDAEQARALLDWAEGTGTVLYHSLVGAAQGALKRAGEEPAFPDRLRSTGRGLGLGMGLLARRGAQGVTSRSTSTSPSARCAAGT